MSKIKEVTKTITSYKTTDGEAFDSKEAAERHERELMAERAYQLDQEVAKRKIELESLNQELAQRDKTNQTRIVSLRAHIAELIASATPFDEQVQCSMEHDMAEVRSMFDERTTLMKRITDAKTFIENNDCKREDGSPYCLYVLKNGKLCHNAVEFPDRQNRCSQHIEYTCLACGKPATHACTVPCKCMDAGMDYTPWPVIKPCGAPLCDGCDCSDDHDTTFLICLNKDQEQWRAPWYR